MTMEQEKIGAPEIIKAVSLYFSIKVEDITGPSQIRHFAYARKIAMYLCREILNYSYPGIGVLFGGRAHPTVMYAVKGIGKRIESSDECDYKNDVIRIKNIIYNN